MNIDEILKPDEKARADALLQEALKAPLCMRSSRRKLAKRIAELKAVR
jgi:hypothetical protein